MAVGRPGDGVLEVSRMEHTPKAVDGLVARIATLEPDPAEVRVVIESRHGMLVERLVDAGYVVVPVNPDLVARRRGPAKKKDDSEDARIACLPALDRFERLRPLIPHGEIAGELRAIARDDERAARDERRLLNRLRQDLIIPSRRHSKSAATTSPPPLLCVCWNGGPPETPWQKRLATRSWRWPGRATTAGPNAWPTGSKPPSPPTTSSPGTTWCGPRRTPSVSPSPSCWRSEPREEPGSGAWARCCWEPLDGAETNSPERTSGGSARIAAEIGDHPEQFESPNAVQCYAGRAPVTRRSGKSELVVACRLAQNRFLGNAVQQWAFCSLRRSGWAREFYDTQRARGKGHHAALRALGNRWLEVLWHCLHKGVLYDENIHVAHRNRAHGKTAKAA